jgi:Metal-dependent hydrolases of the beta-lactamase superfamily I
MALEVHVLASGSDGNCIVVKHDDTAVMIDAGLSGKMITSLMNLNGLDADSIKAILVTHEHSDHISGAGIMARKLDVPVYCNERTFAMSSIGKVQYEQTITSMAFSIDDLEITPHPTSHNAIEPNAYEFSVEGKHVLIATDTGKITNPVEDALSRADLAIVESNYDKTMLETGPYPPSLKRLVGSDIGHLSNINCAEALMRTMHDRRTVFLAHLSRNNNTPDTARETVSKVTGIKRAGIDCLEFYGDTRVLKV